MSEEPEDPGGGRVHLDDRQDVPVDRDALGSVVGRAAEVLDIPAEAVAVLLVDAATIAEMKRDALGIHEPTDVLSFPIDDPSDPAPGPVMVGDLVLCPSFAARTAGGMGRSLDRELTELAVHGLLHLRGRDHQTPAAEIAMAREQRAIVRAVGGAR